MSIYNDIFIFDKLNISLICRVCRLVCPPEHLPFPFPETDLPAPLSIIKDYTISGLDIYDESHKKCPMKN